MPQPEPPASDAADTAWRLRQVVADSWQRSRVAGFLYVFGWVVVAGLADVHRLAPTVGVAAALAFLAGGVLRWRLAPPADPGQDAQRRWLARYAAALTFGPLLWSGLLAWLLQDPRFDVYAVMVAMIATIGYATVIVNVYAPMPRTAAVGAALLFLPMLSLLWLQPERRPLAVAATLYACYLVGALSRSHGEYQRRLDLDAELRAQRDRYETLSRQDPLTGLNNRRHFAEQLQRMTRADDAFALLILDLDHFKRVNDVHGHALGDTCLRLFAERLRAAFPPPALLARLGGEEFGVLLEDAAGAPAAAEAFRRDLAARPWAVEGASLALTVSIGVGRWDPHRHRDGDGFYREVDRALYAAKDGGRDRVRADVAG